VAMMMMVSSLGPGYDPLSSSYASAHSSKTRARVYGYCSLFCVVL
jgi:hypothetical protein